MSAADMPSTVPSAPATLQAPTATYRLQLHADFTFADATALVPYLQRLGISHVYCSPVLRAVPGSGHGYDVLDPSEVSPELGGEKGLRDLAAACHEAGMGVVVDIVPNHMALVAPQWSNGPVWDVLTRGRAARHAAWFDIDWDQCDGRFGLPVLGGTLRQALDAGELVLDIGKDDEGPAAGQPVFRYFAHTLPVAAGTLPDDLPEQRPLRDGDGVDLEPIVEAQHWMLACWRDAATTLNYRRFFEVDELIGVRVEIPEVFEATHATVLRLHHDGVIDAFRIDHPDGLADPEGYLERLASRLRPGTPVWVEKILEADEDLPPSWACSGTTGYDALQVVQTALVDPATVEAVDAAWSATGGEPDLSTVIEQCKRQAVDALLRPEVARLHRAAVAALPESDPDRLASALREMLVHIGVYRAYVRPGERPPADAIERLAESATAALTDRPDLEEELAQLRALAQTPRRTVQESADEGDTKAEIGERRRAALDFAVRLQQTCGPVMAKGIEDTAFYRWHRLVALNDVGGDPEAGRAPDVDRLHAWAERQQSEWAGGMTTLSTHDTKRSEDVRARLLALAGRPQAWHDLSEHGARLAREHGVDLPTGHLAWQTVVGAHPLTPERLTDYLLKASREGKERTAWVDGDEAYEERVVALGQALLDDADLTACIERVLADAAGDIEAVVLGAKALQLCLPGVPDVYQGCERPSYSLVDPDNRRPVDYEAARAGLDAVLGDTGIDWSSATSLEERKQALVAAVLRWRRDHPEGLNGYEPIDAGEHVVAFTRGDLTCLVTRSSASLPEWGDHEVRIPPGRWRDLLTGTSHPGGGVPCDHLFADAPVAVLVRDEEH